MSKHRQLAPQLLQTRPCGDFSPAPANPVLIQECVAPDDAVMDRGLCLWGAGGAEGQLQKDFTPPPLTLMSLKISLGAFLAFPGP